VAYCKILVQLRGPNIKHSGIHLH